MKNPCNITKERDHSLDMAKGFLMAFLIVHHLYDTGRSAGIDNPVLDAIRVVQPSLFVCYFMPTFFLITGMCSNFDKKIKDFFVNQFKTLLMPAFVFILLFHFFMGEPIKTCFGHIMRLFRDGKDYWFLLALFEAKLFYFFINKYIDRDYLKLALLLVLSLVGTTLNDLDSFHNYLVHRHFLDLTLFLGIGHILKKNLRSRKFFFVSLSIYIPIVVFFFLIGAKIPYVTYGFGTTLYLWPVHVMLSITGSIILLCLCQKIRVDYLIEYMGKNSLCIFLMQWYTLEMFMDNFADSLNHNTLQNMIFLYIVIFISTISIGLFVAYITNNTKLRVIMGKF